MSNDWEADVLKVPTVDSMKLYGGADHAASVDKLAAGEFAAADEHPSTGYDTADLDYIAGQEFTRADGSHSR